MVDAGRSNVEIAAALGVNQKTVAWYRYRYNLYAPKPKYSTKKKRLHTREDYRNRINALREENQMLAAVLVDIARLFDEVRRSPASATGRLITHSQMQKLGDLLQVSYADCESVLDEIARQVKQSNEEQP
jgi:hypothetical protein